MNLEESTGRLIYQIKKRLPQRIVPFIVIPVSIFVIGSSIIVLSFIIPPFEPGFFISPAAYYCLVSVFVIADIILGFFGVYSIRIAYPSDIVRLYEKGVFVTIRRQGKHSPPPRTTLSLSPIWLIRVSPHYIPIENIVEIYAVPIWEYTKLYTSYDRGGFIVLRETDGKWYMFSIPMANDINQALYAFKTAFLNRWSSVYSGPSLPLLRPEERYYPIHPTTYYQQYPNYYANPAQQTQPTYSQPLNIHPSQGNLINKQYPCINCGKILQYVPAYKKYYCYYCRRYF